MRRRRVRKREKQVPPHGRAPVPGGPLELALLTALWSTRGATARDLHEQVGAPRGLVYTTVTKVLDRLVAKGMVARRRTGRAYTYRAAAGREETHRAIARRLIERLASGGPRPAVAALLGAIEDVSPELLDELRAALAARRRRRDGA